MKNKNIVVLSFVVGLTLSILAVSVFASPVFLNRGLEEPPEYPVNENRLTYGSAANAISIETEPDLISAIGIDGTEGYVYSKDLHEEMPKTPEEAVAITKAQQKELLAKESKGTTFVRTIPLYDKEGKTVIGEFGITGPLLHEEILND